MKWGLWSTTAASNNATPPDGWPEGQAPSTVNDCAREMMASIRTAVTDLQFIDQGVTPTFVDATHFTLATDQTAYFDIGRRVKASDGSKTLYGTVVSASFIATTGVQVQWDTGGLDGSLSAIASSIVSQKNSSLPDQVYKHRNVLINPYFDIWNTGNGPFALGAVSTTNLCDMWSMVISMSSSLAINASRFELSANVSNCPTLAQAGVLLKSSFGISVSAVVATVGASQFAMLQTCVEGYNFRQIAQKPNALQFWVKSKATGTYCVAIQDSVRDQALVMNYSISSTSWEKKTLLLPPSPSAGTWDYSSGVGLRVQFVLAAGSTFQGGAGNWTAVDLLATSSQINFFSSTSNVFKITGVQLEDGIQCTPLEYKDYLDDQLRCQRYRPFFGSNGTTIPCWAGGQTVNIGQALISLPLVVPARVAPTGFKILANLTAAYGLSGDTNSFVQASSIAVNNTNFTNVFLLVNTVGATGLSAAGHATLFYSNISANSAFVLTGAELS